MLPFASAMMMAGAGGAPLNVADLFKAQLYTGNGSTQTITTGIAADLVHLKSRSDATGSGVFDTSRGIYKSLSTDNGNAERTPTGAKGVTAFSPTGFDLGPDEWVSVNGNASTYVAWNWKKAPRFFDIVIYTGNGANRTIPHALGVAPGLVRVKKLSGTAAWRLWHKDLTSAAYGIGMSNPEASEPTLWNSTAPTAAVFSLGTHSDVNASGATYVAYLYAHDTQSDGIIRCGIFTPDGSGNATVSGLPFQPQYGVFAYRNAAIPYWTVSDTTRGWGVGSDAYIFEATTAAEAATDFGAPTSDGFTINAFASGEPCLYMVIAAP